MNGCNEEGAAADVQRLRRRRGDESLAADRAGRECSAGWSRSLR
jgi:hypothetical protein